MQKKTLSFLVFAFLTALVLLGAIRQAGAQAERASYPAMSSDSVIGRCKMTVPAAEKITTRMISTTPVLIELRVFQILRAAEPSEGAMTFFFLTWLRCTYCSNPKKFPQTFLRQGVGAKCADFSVVTNEA